ncbi:hypothetical protein QQS21_009896 [Conoideocrella luteorostrata]|uniref:Uncharacterized protein n=1 Tax=Conoideocrella luteorostrata TaxID=1105319 RepID=A0AAJ0CIF4_9HYPO|nr:hypothetical protein QQS21_009896 [Conoideocrella luteorostrata]
MDDAQEFNDVRGVRINAGNDDDADTTFEVNSKRITVSVFATSSRPVTAADEDYEDLINEALDAILDVGGPIFFQVAPPRRDPLQSASLDLHSHLYPDTLDFRLQAIDGEAELFQVDPDEAASIADATPDPRFPTGFQPDNLLPQYSTEAISVEHVFVSENCTVSRVQGDGQNMLCKARRTGLQDPGLAN